MARMLLSVLGIFLCAGALAQNVALKGVVKDNTGEKLTGVSIIVENTSIGTTTNSDGEYSIEAPKGSTLVFFFLGFESQRVEVGSRTVVDVVMTQAAVGMDEVVVVGYGTQSRRTITSAVTKIDGNLVKGTPVNTLGEALKGKIAGARVYSSNNTPGADPVIRIRGGSSIDEWLPGSEADYLAKAVERIRAAGDWGDFAAVLWHQGEADSAHPERYGAKLRRLVAILRTELGNPSLPVVFGEIAHWNWTNRAEGTAPFNAMLRNLRIPHTACVSAEGLAPMKDETDPHFSAASQRELGHRYVEALLKIR